MDYTTNQGSGRIEIISLSDVISWRGLRSEESSIWMMRAFTFRLLSPRISGLQRYPFISACWGIMGGSKGHWKIRHPVAHTGWLNTKADGEFWYLGKPNSNSLRLSDLHEWRWDNQVGLGLHWRSSPHVQQEFEYPNLKEGRTPLPSYCRCVFSRLHSGVHWQHSLRCDLGSPPTICTEWVPTSLLSAMRPQTQTLTANTL